MFSMCLTFKTRLDHPPFLIPIPKRNGIPLHYNMQTKFSSIYITNWNLPI